MDKTRRKYETDQNVSELDIYTTNAHDQGDTSPHARHCHRAAQEIASRNARRCRSLLVTTEGDPNWHRPLADLWEALATFTAPNDEILAELDELDATSFAGITLGQAARAAAATL